jgi:hypothetical protein
MINQKIIQKTMLFVATPCYGGLVNEKYTQSLINLTSKSMKYGMGFGYFTRSNV